MYKLRVICILSLLPIATLVFVNLMIMPWFQTGLDWFAKIGAVYFWIVFVALIIKGRKRQGKVSNETL